MARAENRHHEERVKDRWRRRLRGRQWGETLATWKAGPSAKWIQKYAPRFAHHNKCPCFLCRRPRYDRHRDR